MLIPGGDVALEEQLIHLQLENTYLKGIIVQLESRITELEDSLRKSKINKNSSNSSKPPSTDMFIPKRNQSLREPSGKKTGGQPGHKGSTLEMSSNPDEIIKLVPDFCNSCGNDLSKVS